MMSRTFLLRDSKVTKALDVVANQRLAAAK